MKRPMHATDESRQKQSEKRTAFTVMNNVRDYCKQPASKKVLMFVLATYCDHDGVCYPKNETLARAACVSSRTVKRLLRELAADGEVEILAPGIGRDKKRILCLRRYAARKGDKAVSPLNGTGSLGKTSRNSHGEQPTNNQSEYTQRDNNLVPASSDAKEPSEETRTRETLRDLPDSRIYCRISKPLRPKGNQSHDS
jgi:hypothetical protein